MSSSSFAQRLAVTGTLPRFGIGIPQPVRLGFLAPLSGPVQSWGLPGLHGCRIWADWINRSGGILIDGKRYPVELVPYDCGYDGGKAVEGARALVQTHDVKLLMMLGGDTFAPVQHYLTAQKILTSTLLPSDLSPDTPYLIAPSELHPIYNVTGVQWLTRHRPELATVAMCSQTDALGLPSLATYRAAFQAAGVQSVREIRYDPSGADPVGMVAAMMAADPDILCWCTSYTPMVHALTEAAHSAGFSGQMISCTLDNYDRLVARTSPGFMEGFVFQFPDFDDPALAEKAFFFNRPKVFFDEYNQRFPDSWSAVSWEYAAILDLWHAAVERAGSVSPISVLAAMKQDGQVMHAFGPAEWWGRDMFGIDNALVGDWPVVTIQSGKARIVEFGSIPNWLKRHESILRRQMEDLGQMWFQRQGAQTNRVGISARGFGS
ncbi:MAG: ABC transporter substrate-binding protein [Paracoccaceae bacterium]